ncbi:MAG: transposase [Phycisphaerales bacterium]|nr:transposase [Phycisphaerales bacterium]
MTRIRRWLLLALIGVAWILLTITFGYCGVMLVMASIDFNGPPGSAWVATYIDRLASPLDDWETWMLLGVNAVIISVSQVLFLLPVFRFKPELGGRKSLRLSMVVAGLGAAILSTGLLMGLMSLGQLITGTVKSFPQTLYLDAQTAIMGQVLVSEKEALPTLIAAGVLVASWVLWSIVLVLFVKRKTVPEAIRRITGLLFAGTVLEILLVIPLDAMVRRRAECECATGSFQMLLGAVAAATWLLGPGLFALVVLRRPAYWGRYCPGCGHAKGPRGKDAPTTCPECGRAWIEGDGPAG